MPGTPSSRASTLEPSPSSRAVTPSWRQRANRAVNWSASSGSAKNSAGPPSCNHVCMASGSLGRTIFSNPLQETITFPLTFPSRRSAACGPRNRAGAVKLGLVEIGPQTIRDPNLGIADLPQQEVADAHFVGGADEQVGLGHSHRVQVRGDGFFLDVLRPEPAREDLGGHAAEGIDQLGPAAVVYRQAEPQAAVAAAGGHRAVDFLERVVGQALRGARSPPRGGCAP